ncbi:hypothetical protein [Rhodococcus ruber]|uniref:hypothetical protein n=1 Tax=Rhodococcus ruber TaxID=1830 RepID=UPI0012697E00|nr:hypothetical protein [Rhodococcus ruber]
MDELTPSQEFARVKMDGERFARGHLPVSVLSELENYTALIREAAKLTWQEEHPDEDLPEDFASSFDLTLTEIKDGSADCVLQRSRSNRSDYAEYFDQARERIGREIRQTIIGLVEQTDECIARLDAFGNFGSSLNEDESLEVPTLPNEAPARITHAIYRERIFPAHERSISREAIIDEAPRPSLYNKEGWLVGRLNAISANKSRFDLATEKYGDVHGLYKDDEILDDLRAVLGKSEQAPLVRIFGTLQLRSEFELFRMKDASAVQVLEIDEEPWSRRFIELGSLESGWEHEDPDSEPVSFAALDGARKLLIHSSLHNKPQPGIFPQTDGGVSLEWASPDNVYSIEITPDAGFHLFHLGPDDIPFSVETIDASAAEAFIEGVKFP